MKLLSIRDVQTSLKSAGCDPGQIDGIVGPKTYAAVKAFQLKNGLTQDNGVIDWDVLKALFPAYEWSGKLAIRALQIACTQVGVREATGKNDGVEVEAYLKGVSLGKGYSYCMAFVVWDYDQAAIGLGVKSPLAHTGGCLDQLRLMLKSDKVLIIDAKDYNDPQTGDIGILDLKHVAPGFDGPGHTFMVVSAGAPGRVNTVEGNTNDDGSANGDGDYFRDRSITSCRAYIRVL